MSFHIAGAPRTKKNHNRLVRAGRFAKILPSKAYKTWHRDSSVLLIPTLRRYRAILPLREPVNVRALFYRHALVGDATGFYQALADLLQDAGIVENDKWVVSWDGSRLLKDAQSPRVEVEISAVEVA